MHQTFAATGFHFGVVHGLCALVAEPVGADLRALPGEDRVEPAERGIAVRALVAVLRDLQPNGERLIEVERDARPG